MTGYGYEDPRSIYSKENRKRAGIRTPKEILDEMGNCPKCGAEEVYIRKDGKTLLCWKCKHTFTMEAEK